MVVENGNGDGENNGSKYIPDQTMEQEAKDALNAADSDTSEPLTRKIYEEWRDEQSEEYPSYGKIEYRLGEGDWKEACKQAGVTPGSVTRLRTDEYYEQVLTRAYKAVDGDLSVREYRSWAESQEEEIPTHPTIASRLGGDEKSWIEACKSIGVSPAGDESTTPYTIEEIEAALHSAVSEMGEPLTAGKYSNWRENQDERKPAVQTIIRMLDGEGWNNALQQLNISTGEKVNDSYTTEELRSALKKAANNIGESISLRQYRNWREEQDEELPSSHPIAEQLGDGGWEAAVQSVGLQPGEHTGGDEKYSDDEIESALKAAGRDIEKTLTIERYEKWCEEQPDSFPTRSTIATRLGDGSWVEAKKRVLDRE